MVSLTEGRPALDNFTHPAAVMPLAKSKTLLGPCLKDKVEVFIVEYSKGNRMEGLGIRKMTQTKMHLFVPPYNEMYF